MSFLDNLANEFKEAILKIRAEDIKNMIPNISAETLSELVGSLKNCTQSLRAEDINQLFEAAKVHCQNNPVQAAFLVLQIVLLAYPAAVITPFLAALGFAGPGPLAGSAAAAFQSAYGVNTVFSIFQSAGMSGSGYGAAILAGGVRIASAAGAAANLAQGAWRNWTSTAPAPHL